jgi:hypothetical protein
MQRQNLKKYLNFCYISCIAETKLKRGIKKMQTRMNSFRKRCKEREKEQKRSGWKKKEKDQ